MTDKMPTEELLELRKSLIETKNKRYKEKKSIVIIDKKLNKINRILKLRGEK